MREKMVTPALAMKIVEPAKQRHASVHQPLALIDAREVGFHHFNHPALPANGGCIGFSQF